MDYQTKTSLILPFKGIWIVGNGGRDPNKNSHYSIDGNKPKSQTFAYDFYKPYQEKGEKLVDYEAFGSEVIAPADGIISQVVDGSIDVLPGERDKFVFPGNMIVIDHGNSEWSVLAHFKHNSIRVKSGEKIKQRDVLGLCGNTGNTSEPHIHYHLQDNALMHRATGLPVQFKQILVNSELKENFEPERGQKVANLKSD